MLECRSARPKDFPPPSYSRTCQHCGAAFTSRQSTARYCRRNCADRARALLKRELRASQKVEVQCEGPDCEVMILRAPSLIRGHVFCSHACKLNYHRSQQETRTCQNPACARAFLVPLSKPTQRFCCKPCAREVQNAMTRMQKERLAEVLAGPDFRDVASELGGEVKYSSLCREATMEQSHPFENDIYVGF